MHSPAGLPKAAVRIRPARAGFALGLLTLAYSLNFLDRQILAILLVPIQKEFGASDTAMGALAGMYFAALFTLAGIPLAQLADRGNRRNILAFGLLAWSAMTLLCGLSRTFVQLALARVGVGIGEATCLPASHSMISDLYPSERRPGALAIFSSGIHLGTLIAFALGGWFAARYGWRSAFLAAGAPGVLLALVLRWRLREPRRVDVLLAGTDLAQSTGTIRAGLRELFTNPRFLLLAGGASATSVVGYGYVLWNPAFLARLYKMPVQEVGLALGLVCGIGGAIGTLGSGMLAGRLARAAPYWLLGVPAIALGFSILFYAGYVLAPNRTVALVQLFFAQICAASWFGPVFAAVQNAVRPERRALAASVLLLLVTLVGLGLGPTLVGVINDHYKLLLGDFAIVRSLLVLLVFEVVAVWCFALAALSESD
ncbi:MAG: MFS transporter [Planctomycetes bacterium]|nr:MFS transporter [Planctomycetota bacterium]